ncbi:MAG: phage minor capsid protein [Agathobacter sp.]|nr:phage minor capsid protein [Agathobacter sp.]
MRWICMEIALRGRCIVLTPDYLLRISEGSEEIASQLHNEIIKRIVNRIMLRIGRGEEYLLTSQDQWQISTLQQAGYLLEDIQKEIAKATKRQQSEIAEAMEDAGVKALDYDYKIYQSVGLSPTPLTKSPELIRLMQRNYEATLHEWNNFTRTMAHESQRMFINELDRAYTLVSTGALSYTAAVKEVVNNIVSNGVTVEWKRLDKNGVPYVYHTDTIETATLRAVRTGISQATAQIQLARMEEMDCDKVIISSHLGARPSHQVWQGKIFTMDELKSTDDGMPALGTATGLSGINCRHSFSPFFEGMDNPFEQYDSEENRKQYEKEQYQRTLERRIRKTKREVMGLKEGVDNATSEQAKFELDLDYQRKSELLAKQNAAYKEYCERNNLKPLSDRIQIAKWDRKQAAAARGAAQRYENAHGVSVAKSENKIIKPKSIEEINVESTEALLKSYDARREHFGLNLTPASELKNNPLNPVKSDYTGLSEKTAQAFSDTIKNLSKRYYSGFTRIEVSNPKEVFGSTAFATTSHNTAVDQKVLSINPLKVKEYEKMVDRIKELKEKGFCARVASGKEGSYIATHEFAHSFLDMKSPLKNYVGLDTKLMGKCRKEIEEIYEDYRKEVGVLEELKKKTSGKALFVTTQEEYSKIAGEVAEINKKLQNKKISNYSLLNSDEFMAEAFTEAQIGENQTAYSKRVMEVLDKYFRR